MEWKWKFNSEQQYLLDESMVEMINNNNVPIRPIKYEKQKNKEYAVYVEQLIYLLMVTKTTSHKNQQDNNKLSKNKMIAHLYSSLSLTGYNSFDSVWFYLKIRKASKMLFRNPICKDIPCFKVFKNTEQYKQSKSNQIVAIVNNNQFIRSILDQKIIQQNGSLKICICNEMDGIAVRVGRPFKMTQFLLYRPQQ